MQVAVTVVVETSGGEAEALGVSVLEVVGGGVMAAVRAAVGPPLGVPEADQPAEGEALPVAGASVTVRVTFR
jgi:hypothetical protein